MGQVEDIRDSLSSTMADTECGHGKMRQNAFCQRFASLFWFTVVIVILTLTITAMYTYMSSIQSTTQAVFSLNATDIGIFYAMFEVGSVLSNILTTYFLARKHIPRILGAATSIIMLSCVMLGAPHFFADFSDKLQTTTENRTADELISIAIAALAYVPLMNLSYPNQNRILVNLWTLCGNESVGIVGINNSLSATPAGAEDEPRSTQSLVILVIYCIAGFINGAGYAPTYAMVTSYLDDNVKKDHGSSKYIAVFLASYSIGPIAGFGLGAIFLNFYITFESTYLTPDDDEWLGAWWLGYFVFGAILLFTAPLLCFFPKRMPGLDDDDSNSLELEDNQQSSNEKLTSDKSEKENNKIRNFRDLLPTMAKLITNPLYMLESFAACAAAYYVAGWIGYLPKYFEEQFLLSATMASVLAGAAPPITGAPVIIISGYLCSKYKLTIQQDAKLLFFSVLGSTLLMVPLFFVNCTQYSTKEVPVNLTLCTSTCGCDAYDYTPVCLNGVSYKSPCYSGCTGYYKTEQQIIYTGCFCEANATMTKGICQEENCMAPWIYTACSIVSMCFIMASATSAVTVLMRSVPQEDKSFALGVQSALSSLTAWIPSPILYGTVIDSTCKVWEYPEGTPDNPDFYGYCLEYNNHDYMLRYLGTSVGAMTLASILLGLGWWVSYLPRYQAKPDDSQDNNQKDFQKDQEKSFP